MTRLLTELAFWQPHKGQKTMDLGTQALAALVALLLLLCSVGFLFFRNVSSKPQDPGATTGDNEAELEEELVRPWPMETGPASLACDKFVSGDFTGGYE